MLRKVDKPATTREIYFWNMMGSLSNALSSFVFLMIVSRTLIDKQSDIFSLGFSIAQLMFTVATFQMRIFQATDVKEEFSFGKYFGFRVISSVIMLVVLWTYNRYFIKTVYLSILWIASVCAPIWRRNQIYNREWFAVARCDDGSFL
jgi:O-antigen/teichoic acid export membrane protein